MTFLIVISICKDFIVIEAWNLTFVDEGPFSMCFIGSSHSLLWLFRPKYEHIYKDIGLLKE